MGNEAQNVLVGIARLAIRQPNDALAQWVTPGYNGSAHCVKLSKAGSGDAGSTHVQLDPRGTFVDMTLDDIEDEIQAATPEYSFRHKSEKDVLGNYAQLEMRFEDPDSEAWVEVTFCTLQTHTPDGNWTLETLIGTSQVVFGGVDEGGDGFGEYGATRDINGLVAYIQGLGIDCNPGDWELKRIRLELWEPTPARYAYIDELILHGLAYEIEPGAETAPGLTLSSPYTDVGYTEDGVTVNYTVDIADVEVDEESFAIGGNITKETLEVVCNMAESSLFNIDKAIAGSVLSGSILTIGAGILKEMAIKLTGITPAGTARSYEFPRVIATGSVGMTFKRAEKTIVPLTFRALKPAEGNVGTFVDNA